MSYVYDAYIFHYIVDQGMTFLCMASEDTKRRLTFSFLEDIMKNWRERYGIVEQTALAFSLNDVFSPVLRERMDYYSSSPTADTISVVQARIDNVKDIMVENIDRVLERGEKIELLVDKTEQLSHQAFKFEKGARTLKNDMYWRAVRNKCIILFVILLIILFITLMVCGLSMGKCSSTSSSK